MIYQSDNSDMEKHKSSKEKDQKGLASLLEQLPGQIEAKEGIQILTLAKATGVGYVKHQRLQRGIKIFDFDITLVNDTEIFIQSLSNEKLNFFYCLDGKCLYKFEGNNERVLIEQFQTAVAHNKSQFLSSLFVNRNERLILNIIFIDKDEYFKKFNNDSTHEDKLASLLNEISKESKYIHSGGFSLKIAEQLKLLSGLEHENDISEKLSQKGRYYIVLAKQIEQFYNEVNNKSNSSNLLQSELVRISEISEYIKKSPEVQHSIKSLCKKSNLSPAKLQEGFKFMFERTVSDFVRHVRLEKAVYLLNTSDLTISEIVYTVGLTSRSYFCKIFKQRHKCSPKEFRQKIKSTSSS